MTGHDRRAAESAPPGWPPLSGGASAAIARAGRIVCALLVVALPGRAGAYSDYRFEHLSLEHGLPQTSVQAMLSDHLGYLWLGTQYGLSRYNGYDFRTFRHDPGDPNSLSNSRIQALEHSSDGRIWIGTRDGLDRLDPETLRIERIRPDWSGFEAPPETNMAFRDLIDDGAGNLVAKAAGHVLVYRGSSGAFTPVRFEPAIDDLESGQLLADREHRIWLFTTSGLWRLRDDLSAFRRVAEMPIDRRAARRSSIALLTSGQLALAGDEGVWLFDPESEERLARIRPTDFGHSDDWVGAVAADPRGWLWIITRDTLVQYEPDTGRWRPRFKRWLPGDSTDGIQYALDLDRDDNGYVWIGMPEGIGVSGPDGESFQFNRPDPGDPNSLTASPWTALYRVHVDDFGVVWAGGGLGGLSRFSPHSTRFERVRHEHIDPQYGTDNVVRSVLEQHTDEGEFLWTGLSHAGIRVWARSATGYDRVADRLHSHAAESKRLPGGTVTALARDPVTGRIWASVGRRLVVIAPESREVLAVHAPGGDRSVSSIRDLLFSADGSKLMIADRGSMRVLALDAERRQPRIERSTHLGENTVYQIKPLPDGRVLAATRLGVAIWDPQSGAVVHDEPAGQPGEHPRNFIFSVAHTPDGSIWLGSQQGGLARGRFEDGAFTDWRWYGAGDGLPDETVYAILPSESGYLWLSGNRGLVRFNPDSGRFRHFTLGDGLQALEFNNTVAAIGPDGRFAFGGIAGATVFRPDEIRLHPESPRLLLQRVELAGEPVDVHPGRAIDLDTTHDRSSLLIEFAGLHFIEPERNRYAYRLEGVDADWVEAGNSRVVRYPDPPPGDYRFSVRAANSDGVWSGEKTLMRVRVAPPPWRTPWAYSLYVAAGVLLVAMMLFNERRRRRRLEQLVAERTSELREQKRLVDRQAGELAEVLDTRTTLFANISHEFRTPLTLIEAGIDRLVRNPEDRGAAMAARRYLRRLLRLVDQLLNLSRLQSQRDEPVPDPWSVDRLVTMTVDAFHSLAEQRGIRLETRIEGRWLTQCRQSDIERILLNLLGNALKYCPAGSSVTVSLTGGNDGIVLAVADDGPGIAPEQQERIFDRFSRMPSHENDRFEGAGIGLTLVREAARANGGRVEVDSEPGRGARFRVWLPGWRDHMEGAPVDHLTGRRLELELENLQSGPGDEGDATVRRAADAAGTGRLGVAMVVEDNADLRAYLAEALAPDWDVIESGNGREALELARERIPDVVVSDIMMPGLDGLELLKRLRRDVRTSHLPVLLLTARQDEATRLQGFSLSADDFLAKPFNPAELRLRLQRMIDIRSRVQARLWRQVEMSGPVGESPAPEGNNAVPDLSERDAQLLERVRVWLEANHDDPEAGVSDMAEFVSVEPRTLQRKLKALTGRTPAAHLQNYRLECARRMLAETSRPVQDIAYSCGFSSPQYFARVFSGQQGVSPSNWRRRARKARHTG